MYVIQRLCSKRTILIWCENVHKIIINYYRPNSIFFFFSFTLKHNDRVRIHHINQSFLNDKFKKHELKDLNKTEGADAELLRWRSVDAMPVKQWQSFAVNNCTRLLTTIENLRASQLKLLDFLKEKSEHTLIKINHLLSALKVNYFM